MNKKGRKLTERRKEKIMFLADECRVDLNAAIIEAYQGDTKKMAKWLRKAARRLEVLHEYGRIYR